jgi:hypothetical protein
MAASLKAISAHIVKRVVSRRNRQGGLWHKLKSTGYGST